MPAKMSGISFHSFCAFERRCPKQNTVARLKSKDFVSPKIFGLAAPLLLTMQREWALTKLYLFYTTKKMPGVVVTATIIKNALC